MANIILNRFPANLSNKEFDFDADDIKVALLKAAYTPDKDHNVWADISAQEVVGAGYTTGGESLTNTVVTQDDANDLCKLDADDAVFTSVTLTGLNAPQYAAVYNNTLAGKDLMCIYDFGSSVECNGGDFTVEFDANGMMKLVQGV